ncbi:hypothetical protein JAB8_38370 [Janthinobacterium sp. HH106]|uniref:hypothetical protein n=1 Tax=Janthinobacterium sp. HH106 TaxID=1537278 RepID=UPI0008936729|nr:hypothetical protein [Janthinobacterium sp. HH106]OEZ85655.1 hypothetical protein JAB8_38370 [Janthinobacterium sp. HH106]
MKNTDLEPIFSWARKITLTAVFFSLALLSLYFYNFAPKNNFQLSSADGAWANFGGYIGGVLGPLFSFLAFAGVLLTVWLQKIQLERASSQANIDEFQRVLANVSLQLDGLLAHRLEIPPMHPGLPLKPETIFFYIGAAGSAALNSSSDYIVEARKREIIDKIKPSIWSIAAIVGIELQQLAWCIEEHNRLGGAKSVAEFYKRRYEAVVGWLDAISFLNKHQRVHACWDVTRIRQDLTTTEMQA